MFDASVKVCEIEGYVHVSKGCVRVSKAISKDSAILVLGQRCRSIIKDLLEEVRILSKKLSDAEMKREREKDMSGLYHQRYQESEVELKNKQKKMVSLCFGSDFIYCGRMVTRATH